MSSGAVAVQDVVLRLESNGLGEKLHRLVILPSGEGAVAFRLLETRVEGMSNEGSGCQLT